MYLITIILLLSSFIGKGGVSFDLDWDRQFSDTEVKQLALSAFFESYRQSHTFDHLDDKALEKEIVKFWKEKKDHLHAHHVISARVDGTLVGIAVFEKCSNDTVYLAELMTSPLCWGQGLGTKLIYSILEKDPTVKKIVLICEKANTKTVHYYRSLGFNTLREDPNYITFQKQTS